jgi:hypothetical protein
MACGIRSRIESVLKQTFGDWDILLLDNYSKKGIYLCSDYKMSAYFTGYKLPVY